MGWGREAGHTAKSMGKAEPVSKDSAELREGVRRMEGGPSCRISQGPKAGLGKAAEDVGISF